MKVKIETAKNSISFEVLEISGSTRECWEQQGKEILKMAYDYIVQKELGVEDK